jgi:uncharacterized repeat protein (TIGR02543 family)
LFCRVNRFFNICSSYQKSRFQLTNGTGGISLEVSMKQLKSLLFLTAALCVIAQGTFILAGCGDIALGASNGLGYNPQEEGDTGVKKGGGSGESVAGLAVEFKTQGGSWLTQEMPEGFWNSVINGDATVNLPSAYIRRDGMIFLGWYDKAQPVSQQALENYSAEDGDSAGGMTEENIPETAPYLLSDEPVPEDGRFTEKTKITAGITLYAWWQQLEAGAKVVSFIPYWMEGARGFKRQAVLQEDGETYKIAQHSFPKLTGGPEHYHAVDSAAAWWTETEAGAKFTADTAAAEDMTVYGHWAGNEYKVSFHVNGTEAGADGASFQKKAVYPDTVTLTAGDKPIAPDGYTFLGWFTEQKPLITGAAVPAPNDPRWFKPGITPLTADIDVYGLWQNRPEGSWSVTFKTYFDDENAISTAYAVSDDGYRITSLPENVTREHYTRNGAGWYYKAEGSGGGEEGGMEFTTDTAVTQDIVVYAAWTGKEYTVTFKRWDNNASTETVIYPAALASAAKNIPAVGDRTHYTSNGKWYISVGGAEFTADTPITENITVTPVWIGKTYTVTFDGNGGTPGKESVSVKYPDGNMSANPGATMGSAIAAAERKDYRFDGWYKDTVEITGSSVITADITVTAQWTLIVMEWVQTEIKTGNYNFGMGQDGKFYVADGTNGIKYLNLNGSTWEWENTNITSGFYYAFGIGQDGILYAGGYANGIKRLKLNGSTWEWEDTGIASTGIYSGFGMGQNGILYAGNMADIGIWLLDGEIWKKTTSASAGAYFGFGMGQNNKLYVGSADNKGIKYLNDNKEWKNTNITSRTYYGFGMGQDGKLYAGSAGNGIWYLDSDSDTWKKTGTTSGTYYGFGMGQDGILYAGCDKGIKRLNANGEWENTNITSEEYKGFGMGQDGKLYAGSYNNKGIMRLQEKN